MADHDEGQAALLAQAFQEVQHLGLHRSVQRRGRLVQQQHLGLQDQRPCHGHTLALPTRELMRVTKAIAFAQAHVGQGLLDALFGVAQAVDGQRLGQDAVHRLAWVQAGVGILKNHLHAAAKGLAPWRRTVCFRA